MRTDVLSLLLRIEEPIAAIVPKPFKLERDRPSQTATLMIPLYKALIEIVKLLYSSQQEIERPSCIGRAGITILDLLQNAREAETFFTSPQFTNNTNLLPKSVFLKEFLHQFIKEVNLQERASPVLKEYIRILKQDIYFLSILSPSTPRQEVQNLLIKTVQDLFLKQPGKETKTVAVEPLEERLFDRILSSFTPSLLQENNLPPAFAVPYFHPYKSESRPPKAKRKQAKEKEDFDEKPEETEQGKSPF